MLEPTRRGIFDRPLAQLTITRLKEVLREPEAIFWSYIFPVLLAVGLGVAFRSRPPEVVRVGVRTEADTGAVNPVISALRAEKNVEVVPLPTDSAVTWALRTGRVALVVRPTPSGVRYEFDDTRPEARLARLVVDAAVQRGSGRRDPVEVGEMRVRERGSRYIDFLIPGLLGMNIMAGAMWSIGFSIADARRKNLLKRLVASPMPRASYLGSYILTRLIFLVVEVTVLLSAAIGLFHVPLRGSIAQLVLIAVVGCLTFSGMGLLVASRARTIEAVSGLMNVAMMPMWVLSGIFFSASNFPPVAQPFIQALPLTALIDALRGNMLQASPWGAILPELAILGAWLVVCFGLALRLFRWR